MEPVVKEELRETGALGRELIEGEEAVHAVDELMSWLIFSAQARDEACANAARRVAAIACRKVVLRAREERNPTATLSALEDVLMDPNIRPGPHTMVRIHKATLKRPYMRCNISAMF